MKGEVLVGFLHDGAKFEEGEVRAVSDELGEYFCRAGWMKDLSGDVKTGSPEKDEVVLLVDNSAKESIAKEVM